jgi:REP element-mobilizing transposase RayT
MYKTVHERNPFETIAICVLPDHLHAIWALRPGCSDFATRWSLIKSAFSRGLAVEMPRSASKLADGNAEYGSVVIGSTWSEMTAISSDMPTTSISIRSSTGM